MDSSVDVGCGSKSGDRNNDWTHNGGTTQSKRRSDSNNLGTISECLPVESENSGDDRATVGRFVFNQRATVVDSYSSSE